MLNDRSLRALAGVHPDLVRVVERAAGITHQPFIVTEGLRTLARQKALVAKGASRTLRSRHLTGHAVDVAALLPGGAVSWDSEPLAEIARAMKQAAAELGVPIEWGGDWRSFTDTPHFQLPWAAYPAGDRTSHAWAGARADADGWHTETMAETAPPPPPGSMLASKTGNTSAAISASSVPQYGVAVAQAAARASGPRDFLIALACEPLFWSACVALFGGIFVWLERHDKFRKWGI